MFIDELTSLFTDVHILPLVLIIAGLALLILELFFIPGFGAFGILGLLSLVGALISHVVITNSVTQFFILFFILLVAVTILFSILVYSARKGLISHTPLILNGSSVSKEYFEKNEKEIKKLLGRTGVCISKIDPVGIILIDGKEYEATTRTGLIDKDDNARVISVDKGKIVIEKC